MLLKRKTKVNFCMKRNCEKKKKFKYILSNSRRLNINTMLFKDDQYFSTK